MTAQNTATIANNDKIHQKFGLSIRFLTHNLPTIKMDFEVGAVVTQINDKANMIEKRKASSK